MDPYYDLGTYSRAITTPSPDAQIWFDRGLAWCYGFNHEEADICFRNALEHDPDCAMAYWGIAYANGPFYNKVWTNFGPAELPGAVRLCHQTSQKAKQLSVNCTPVEQALTAALCERYCSDQVVEEAEFDLWINQYADSMREVYHAFPDDLDVAALFVEAMVTRTPWKLWAIDAYEPAEGADTVEAIEVLDRAMALIELHDLEPHPGLCHMNIHALEMSPYPERGLGAADDLRELSPDSGHLRHMPCHIDALCGRYSEAVTASEKAIAADAIYLAEAGAKGFYATSCCHNLHMMMYNGMFLGRYGEAATAANNMIAILTEDVLKNDRPYLASTLEGYYSMAIHVDVRFGRWQEIVDEPFPGSAELYLVTTAMLHYAKSVAHAALGDVSQARKQQAKFFEARERIPGSRLIFNNPALHILEVGEAMIEGEVAYREQRYDVAFANLREAVDRDDKLNYTEPWAWMHPPRHALGALLLEQGHLSEAKAVYGADLGLDNSIQRSSQHPGNVWSLHGYVECLERLGETTQAASMRPALAAALMLTDTEIGASCACRRGNAG
jgi:tetratricopeptide (TPR) repeat protein